MFNSGFLIPFIYVLAAIFYALLGLYAWRKRPVVAVIPFAWAMLSISIWSFLYGLEIFSPSLNTKILIINLEYIGIIGLPVFLFFFALEYTGRSHLITLQVRVLTWIIPVIVLLLVWTNPLHHFMWDSETVSHQSSLWFFKVHYGVGFWIHIFFSFGLTLVASILILIDFLQSPRALRLQVSLVIFSMLFSILGTVLFVFDISPIKNLDYTPLFFLPTASSLAWVTLRYRLSDILSLEHMTVLKNMQDSVIVLNDQKRILYINPVTEKLIKRTENEAIGQPFNHVAGAFAQILHPHLRDSDYRAEIEIDDNNNTKTFEAAISTVTATSRGTSNIVITLHDVTERKEKEEELSRRSSIMSAVSRAAEKFLKAADWQQNIEAVLMDLGLAADVSRVQFILNSTNSQLAVTSSLKYEWTANGILPQIENPDHQNIPLEAAGLGRWLDDLSNGYQIHGLVKDLPIAEQRLLNQMGSLSIAVVPIFVDSEWWAFMLFDECRAERQWTGMELDAFQTAANILGAAESRTRTALKLSRRQLAMGLLQDIVTVSLQAANKNEMAEIVATHLAKLITADGCFLTLWDDVNEQTIPFAAYGKMKDTYPKTVIKPGEKTFTRSALELEHTLVIDDVNNTPYATSSVTGLFPSKSILVLPLIAKKKKLGAVLVSFEQYHQFNPEEVQVCEQAASLIALALEKFQAMEDANRRADTSESLRKAGIAISEQMELKRAVNRVLEQLKQMLPYDSASVQLLENNELHIIGGNGWENEEDIQGLRFPVPGDNPNTVVLERGTSYYLPDAALVYKQFLNPPHNHIRSWLGIPLIVQEKVIGLLAIDSAKPNDFSEQEIMIATEFANQVAITLENARILEETQNLAITDALTNIHNRRGLFQLGEYEFQRSRRINRPFSAIMFDIDHFKQVNDRYGHAAGDQILYQIAQLCLRSSRTTDLVGRYGGEEFIILLTETNLEAARFIGERLRQSVMNTQFHTEVGAITITSSIGIAQAKNADTLNSLIKRADAALYQAKNAGRNIVIVDD
ncbi:MAG: diguanylate cyclase [Anaerolineales bacterium]|nr:diguanylate cyclase [Anaerolineales bacterium]